MFKDVRQLVSCSAVKVAPKEGDTVDRAKYYQGAFDCAQGTCCEPPPHRYAEINQTLPPLILAQASSSSTLRLWGTRPRPSRRCVGGPPMLKLHPRSPHMCACVCYLRGATSS